MAEKDSNASPTVLTLVPLSDGIDQRKVFLLHLVGIPPSRVQLFLVMAVSRLHSIVVLCIDCLIQSQDVFVPKVSSSSSSIMCYK